MRIDVDKQKVRAEQNLEQMTKQKLVRIESQSRFQLARNGSQLDKSPPADCVSLLCREDWPFGARQGQRTASIGLIAQLELRLTIVLCTSNNARAAARQCNPAESMLRLFVAASSLP